MFQLDALSARKGDALVLRWGTEASPHLALIDGGPSGVWEGAIQPHLADIVGTTPAGEPNPVNLELVVVSHVDDDHIRGIIDLAVATDAAQKQYENPPATIAEVWHNTFGDLQLAHEFTDEPKLRGAITSAAANPASLADGEANDDTEDAPIDSIAATIQSIPQGQDLEHFLQTIRVPRNTRFSDSDGFARDGESATIDGLRIKVLAPNTTSLGKLKKLWEAELKKKKTKPDDDSDASSVRALAAAFDDKSVPNKSSIVLHVTYEGKTMLLTGDVRGDLLLEGIEAEASLGLPLKVDLFKVAHHGSAHSNGPELFEQVTADHYVISGNGEHGNPHPAALQALFDSQRGRHITVHLTNRPTVGAVKPDDVENARKSQVLLDEAAKGADVTIIYRDEAEHAVSVRLA